MGPRNGVVCVACYNVGPFSWSYGWTVPLACAGWHHVREERSRPERDSGAGVGRRISGTEACGVRD
ncbi:hypothetical protein ACU8KH_05251 [Lachancea thermotolerans]